MLLEQGLDHQSLGLIPDESDLDEVALGHQVAW
jgi:hypothetical protein